MNRNDTANRKQATLERTLLLGVGIGLLIGFLSKRIAAGLLLGLLVAVILRYAYPQNKQS